MQVVGTLLPPRTADRSGRTPRRHRGTAERPSPASRRSSSSRSPPSRPKSSSSPRWTATSRLVLRSSKDFVDDTGEPSRRRPIRPPASSSRPSSTSTASYRRRSSRPSLPGPGESRRRHRHSASAIRCQHRTSPGDGRTDPTRIRRPSAALRTITDTITTHTTSIKDQPTDGRPRSGSSSSTTSPRPATT